MKEDELDIDVGVEGVLVEENCTTYVRGYVEPTCKNVRIDIFGRLLRCNDMPPACNLSLEGIFISPTSSRVPVADADSALHNRTGRKVLIGTVHVRRCSRLPF